MRRVDHNYGILNITRNGDSSLKSSSIMIVISNVYFYNNGFLLNNPVSPNNLSSLHIAVYKSEICIIILEKSTFMSNKNGAIYINVASLQLTNIRLTEVLVHNNYFFSHHGVFIHAFSVMGYETSVAINNSNFNDNQNANSALLAFVILSYMPSEVTYYRVQFNNNQGGTFVVFIAGFKRHLEINMYTVNFTHNQYLAGVLYISPMDGSNSTIFLKKCEFVNNKTPGQ